MIQAQAMKKVRVIDPAAIVDDASFTVLDIDARGFNWVQITCYVGAIDVDMVALSVSDSPDDSTYTPVTSLAFSGDDLPQATTGANKFYAFDIDRRLTERYLRLVATGGDGTAGTFMSAEAVLYRGEVIPASDTSRGLEGLVNNTD